MTIQVVRSARANYSIETYSADIGQLFYEESTGDLRLGNGTPGGKRILSSESDVQNYLNSVQGNIVPDQDNIRDLGSPDRQWRDLYLSGNSLFINGIRIGVEDDQLVLPSNTIILDQPVSTFSGSYNDLTDKPFIPTDTDQLINSAGFITVSALIGYATEEYVDSRGFLTSISWNDVQNKPTIPTELSVGLINSENELGSIISSVSILRFDTDSGFDVTDLGNGEVKIGMNSTFKTWKVAGQDDLIAIGLDTVEFAAGTGIVITTDSSASPSKKITFSGFSGNYNDLINTPDLSVYQLASTAFTGNYNDLTNIPVLFSGNYNDLTNKPNISNSLSNLNDVDIVTVPPTFGQVLKYNGTKWVPAQDISGGGGDGGGVGGDADTLNGFSGSFYLDFNNLINKPGPFVLPVATTEVLGGVKLGKNTEIGENDTLIVKSNEVVEEVIKAPILVEVPEDNQALMYKNGKWTNSPSMFWASRNW